MSPGFDYKNYKYTVPIATGLAALGFAFAKREDIKPHIDYASYLIPHKYFVGKAMRDENLPWGQTLAHDLSKFTPSEWPQYVEYFNGPTGIKGTHDPETYLKWRAAVQHHYDNNKHHWRANHLEPKDVPMQYKLEAVADWYGVGRAKGAYKTSFKDWYTEKETFLPIDNATKEEVRKRLSMQPMMKEAAKKKKPAPKKKVVKAKPKAPSVNAPHVPMSMVVASLDPAVLAVSRNVDPAKQKKMWERYARIVLENRNYGRKGRVAGEYIKTQVPKD
jgi:hypothetical protein